MDISNPQIPTIVGSYDTPDLAIGIFVVGNYAYVADYSSGLQIVNVSNPQSPTLAGSYNTPDHAISVFVADNYAYIADGDSGLQIVDVSNPQNPSLAGGIDTPDWARGVFVDGNFAYIADGLSGLQIFNVSNPQNPFFVGSYNTPGHAQSVFVVGYYAYVADYYSGLQIVNVSNPQNPTIAGSYNTPDAAWHVIMRDYYAYVAIWGAGLQILRWIPPYPPFTVISPNGGEEWQFLAYDTVRWQSYGYDGAVRIELNRAYPEGAWEPLADSTDNDGVEAVWVTEPLSNRCRVRVHALAITLADTSDGDFAITSSQGYLALVRAGAPTAPLLSWNAGSVECPQTAAQTFRLKNFGSEAIVVFAPPEPPLAEFARATSCGSLFALAPGQMSACSLTLTFAPGADGAYTDTLAVQTDAVNGLGGAVRFPLTGSQVSTPAAPSVIIQPQGIHARLAWNPVTHSTGGCPVGVTAYLVFYSEMHGGPFFFHGFTTDTSYVHTGVLHFAPAMYYQVIATTAALPALRALPARGTLTAADVRARLGE